MEGLRPMPLTAKWPAMAINFITFAWPMCIVNGCVIVFVVVVGNVRQLINWKLRLMDGQIRIGIDNGPPSTILLEKVEPEPGV